MSSNQANVEFRLLGRSLSLMRYPAHLQHKSLQAWDAADELLIEYIDTHIEDFQSLKISIFNDAFGSLACWFNAAEMSWSTDSYLSKQACLQNLSINKLEYNKISFVQGIEALAYQPDLVLIKIPKTLALLEYQLIQLQNVMTPGTQIIASGKVKSIQKSTLALFDKHIGPTTTSLAKKKARLIFATPQRPKSSDMPYPTRWQTEQPKFTIANHANVFSRQSLDIGARFMLQHLPATEGETVVDLGCGNGILGLSMLQKSAKSKVIFTDESYMAVASAQLNVETNLPDAMQRSDFVVNDCLQGVPKIAADGVEWILCNPPFHQQNTITDHIARQMFSEAKQSLKPGGHLQIVGNRHLNYGQALKSLFGGFKVVATNQKFSILSAQKK